jgi:hypothetical protein
MANGEQQIAQADTDAGILNAASNAAIYNA